LPACGARTSTALPSAGFNRAKHDLSFQTAVKVFEDPARVTFTTTREEDGEDRFKAIGAIEGRIFAVAYTVRGNAKRLISARRANRKEEQSYGARSP